MSHQPLPWSVNRYGELLDAVGDKVKMSGVNLPCGYVGPDDASHANRDLVVRSVSGLNEGARQQVIAAAEARGAALVADKLADLESEQASLCDLLNTWAREEGVRQAGRPAEMKSLAVRLWGHLSRRVAAAEQRGAALAVAQVRRMAEERADKLDWSTERPSAKLREFAACLPATPDLAAEVRRIEEGLLADAESREENARQFGQKEAREGAVKLAEEIVAEHDTPGHCDCDVAEALREFIRRLRESAP